MKKEKNLKSGITLKALINLFRRTRRGIRVRHGKGKRLTIINQVALSIPRPFLLLRLRPHPLVPAGTPRRGPSTFHGGSSTVVALADPQATGDGSSDGEGERLGEAGEGGGARGEVSGGGTAAEGKGARIRRGHSHEMNPHPHPHLSN